MELDDLKTAWQSIHRQMERQNALQLQLLLDGQREKARRVLRPLAWGQSVQMGLGALLTLCAAPFWINHRQVPHLLIAGLILHLYGLALILFGARMHAMLRAVDLTAPVVEIQARLARLRRFYVRIGTFGLGLPWWVLWIPLLMMLLMGLFGADLYAAAPSWAPASLAVGVAGWALTLLLIQRPRIAQTFERVAAGRSLNEAQRRLDEIARFAQD